LHADLVTVLPWRCVESFIFPAMIVAKRLICADAVVLFATPFKATTG